MPFRLFSLIRSSEEFTHEEFLRYWVGEHSIQGRKLPGLRKYSIHDICEENGADRPRWDCLIEMWFDDRAAYERALTSGEWASAERDLHTNAERIILLADVEHTIVQ